MGFYEITEQINELYKRGILSDEDVSQIARALGGGNRRQVDVEAVLKNINEAKRINAFAAGDVAGSANAALGFQLETVQTALTRLNNAFQEFAQTLGDDGGALELITDIVNGLTNLVEVMSSLTSIVGRAAPALATLAALRFLGSNLPQTGLFAGSGVGSFLVGGLAGSPALRTGKELMGTYDNASERMLYPQQNFMRANAGNILYGAAGLLGAGAPIAQNLREGNQEEAIGGGIGAIIGGALGATLGGPVGFAIGATLGQGIAESFVSNVITSEDDLGEALARRLLDQAREAQGEEPLPVEGQRSAETSELYRLVGLGIQEQARAVGSSPVLDPETQGSLQAWLQSLFSGRTKEEIALQLAEQYAPEYLAELEETRRAEQLSAGDTSVAIERPVIDRQEKLLSEFGGLFDDFIGQQRSEVQQGLVTGELTGNQAASTFNRLPGLDNFATQTLAATGDAFFEFNGTVTSTEDALLSLSDLFLNSTDEQIAVINKWIAEISLLETQIAEAEKAGKGFVTTTDGVELSLNDAAGALQELSNQVGAYTNNLITQQALTSYTPPDIFGAGGITPEEFESGVLPKVPELLNKYLQAQFQTDQQRQAYLGEIDPYNVQLSGGQNYRQIEDIPQEVLRLAIAQAQEEGTVGASGRKPSFQEFEFGQVSPERSAFEERYGFYDALLQSVGYQKDTVDTIELYGGTAIENNKRDLLLVRLALQDILEVEQKQLDGIYNLPTDATFWVPLAAAQLVRANANNNALGSDGSGGGISAVGDEWKAIEASQLVRGNLGTHPGFDDFNDSIPQKDLQRLLSKMYSRPLVMDTGDPMSEYARGNAMSDSFASKPQASDPGLVGMLEGIFGAIWNRVEGTLGIGQKGMFAGDSGKNATSVKETTGLRLELAISANFQTRLDGRVIANEVKNYVTDDLLRASSSYNSITRNVAI